MADIFFFSFSFHVQGTLWEKPVSTAYLNYGKLTTFSLSGINLICYNRQIRELLFSYLTPQKCSRIVRVVVEIFKMWPNVTGEIVGS